MTSMKQESKQSNKFQWIFFTLVIPIIFAITLTLVISTIAGINPFQKAQEFGSQIPILSNFVGHPEEENNERKMAEYEATIKDQEAKIIDLEAQLKNKDEQMEELKQQVLEYEQIIEEQEGRQIKEEEAISKLSSSFSEMEPNRAANILIDMEHELAVKILIDLSADIRGKILGSMESEDAATFSNALLKNNN